MAYVVIKLADESKTSDLYFSKDAVALAKSLLSEGQYDEVASFFFDAHGTEAAEEAFDLTNNPCRQYEREKYYGRGRSVSVGDIVEVDNVAYLCSPMGWKVLA
jgi:acetylornithine/succinyldiaminopimelate/putrescine aminotransferase